MYNHIATPLITISLEKIDKLTAANDIDTIIKNADLIEINDGALRLFELDNHEEFREKFLEIIPKNLVEDFIKNKVNTSGSGHFFIRGECTTTKGKSLKVEFHFVDSFAEALGKIVTFTIEDKTKYVEMNNELEILSLLPKTNPNIVALVKCDGGVEYLNPKGIQFISELNRTNKDDILDILLPDFKNSMCSICNKESKNTEIITQNKKTFKMDISPIKDQEKCMMIFTDITALHKISEERNMFYEAIENTSQSAIITDHEGDIVYVNKAFTELYGYTKEETIGRNPRILNPGKYVYYENGYSEAKYNKLFSGLWKKLRNSEESFWEGTVLNKRKNGDLLHVRLTISKIIDEKNGTLNYLALPIDVTESYEAYETVKFDDLMTIASIAELRDNETGLHMQRVGLYAKLLSKFLGQTNKFADDIEVFAPLHDVGKVGITDNILLARRKLNNDEFNIMKAHTTLGYDILRQRKHMLMAADIAKYHHEWYDGTGYPEGLKGDDIPLCARITALCDVYDALRSKRPYKEPWTHDEAHREIMKYSGTHFDPKVAESFNVLSSDFEEIYETMQ